MHCETVSPCFGSKEWPGDYCPSLSALLMPLRLASDCAGLGTDGLVAAKMKLNFVNVFGEPDEFIREILFNVLSVLSCVFVRE